jgi:hypothetical protein
VVPSNRARVAAPPVSQMVRLLAARRPLAPMVRIGSEALALRAARLAQAARRRPVALEEARAPALEVRAVQARAAAVAARVVARSTGALATASAAPAVAWRTWVARRSARLALARVSGWALARLRTATLAALKANRTVRARHAVETSAAGRAAGVRPVSRYTRSAVATAAVARQFAGAARAAGVRRRIARLPFRAVLGSPASAVRDVAALDRSSLGRGRITRGTVARGGGVAAPEVGSVGAAAGGQAEEGGDRGDGQRARCSVLHASTIRVRGARARPRTAPGTGPSAPKRRRRRRARRATRSSCRLPMATRDRT